MTDVIEVKEAVEDTIAVFPEILDSFGDIQAAMGVLNGLLAQELWTGDTKDKCLQIQGLLEGYGGGITELLKQLQQETILLRNHMLEFTSNSESISIISTI